MSRIFRLTPCVLGMILCVGATSAQTVTLSELISYETLRNATGGDDLLHTFSQKPDKVRVTVRCKLKRGEFAWRVEAADGTVLWQKKASAKADLEVQEDFPGQAGEWRVVIEYKNAKGRYHIKIEQVTDP